MTDPNQFDPRAVDHYAHYGFEIDFSQPPGLVPRWNYLHLFLTDGEHLIVPKNQIESTSNTYGYKKGVGNDVWITYNQKRYCLGILISVVPLLSYGNKRKASERNIVGINVQFHDAVNTRIIIDQLAEQGSTNFL